MRLRSHNLKTGEVIEWDTISTMLGGGVGYSVPEEGCGVADSHGQEIFIGDILTSNGKFFLVRKRDGGTWLDDLEDDSGFWLHEVVHKLKEGGIAISISGNCHANAEWIVACINKKISKGIMPWSVRKNQDEPRDLSCSFLQTGSPSMMAQPSSGMH